MRARCGVVVGGFLALAVGCGSSGGGNPPPQQTPDAGNNSLPNDPRAMTYASGLSVTSTSGTRKYVLLSADPAPGARDRHLVHQDHQRGGHGPAGSDGRRAPLHARPRSRDFGQRLGDREPGRHLHRAPLYFFMPGVWRITFWIGSNQADVGEFFFCVPG